MLTVEDALAAYRTYAKTEGKSPKIILWICSGVAYFRIFPVFSVTTLQP